MRVVYASSLISEASFDRCFPDIAAAPGQAVQKYHRLLSAGLAENGAEVIALSAPPVTRRNTNKRCVRLPDDVSHGVRFSYLPVLLFPLVKHIITFVCAFFRAAALLKGDAFVLSDALNLSVSSGARLAARLVRRPAIAIVTDVPDLMADQPTILQRLHRRQMADYDAYLFLTEQMSERINKHNRPYLVQEGHVDASLCAKDGAAKKKDAPPVLLYAGMLHARYGILRLAEAFSMTALPAKLVIYGAGDAENALFALAAADSRICLMGCAENREVVEAEKRATLLINPRPSDAAFTKYSFPSKNMEYMASGTPVLTTRLPGMPKEYEPYVYLFDEETPEAMAKTLESVMARSDAALAEKGQAARSFVLREKNNVARAAQVLSFAGKLTGKKGLRHGK